MLAGVAGIGLVAALATAGIQRPKMKQSPARSGARHRLIRGRGSTRLENLPRGSAEGGTRRVWRSQTHVKPRYWWMIALFIILCAGIAISEWYAYNVNVPHYKAIHDATHH
jgi:hypothetical protein